MALFYGAIFLAFFWNEFSRSTSSHSFMWKPFTPITIADDLLWWQPVGVLIITAGLCLLLRKTLRWSWRCSLSISALWTLPLPTLYFGGRYCIPVLLPPGHRLTPQLTYWGWDFQTIGNHFVWANSMIFFVFAAYPILLLWFNRSSIDKRRQWLWTAVLPLCFLLCLSPFLTMRVWVYGHIEHRVDYACQAQLQEIHLALLRYAVEHENRLPIAADYRELFMKIEPYLDKSRENPIWRRFDVCIIGNALDRPPKPFLWDASLSGREIVRDASWDYWCIIELQEPPDSPTYAILGKFWVDCPYAQERTAGRFRYPWFHEPFLKDGPPFEGFRVINERRRNVLETE